MFCRVFQLFFCSPPLKFGAIGVPLSHCAIAPTIEPMDKQDGLLNFREDSYVHNKKMAVRLFKHLNG